MNSMHNLNACCLWQSAAQFFFFLPKLFMALCHEWHVDKLNACHPWQSAAQFFFFFKLYLAFIQSITEKGIYTKKNLAFIQWGVQIA